MMSRNVTCAVVLALVAIPLGGHVNGQGAEKNKPSITITVVPPWDPGGPDKMAPIEGTVTNAEQGCKVVIYAHGDVWYVQPYVAAPHTTIEKDGQWHNDTHLGTEYAALLVRASYKPPATTGTLPAVRESVLAMTRVPGKK